MIRTWTTLGLTTLLTAAPAAGPVAAQSVGPADPPKSADPRQELEQLRSDTIRSFQAAKKDIDALREEVGRLRKDLDDLRNTKPITNRISDYGQVGGNNVLPDAQRDIDSLKEQIAQIRKSLDDWRKTRSAERRISGYGPARDAGAAGTGSIVLQNTYPAEITVVVSGERYTLAPGEKRVLAGRPAGAFTYEVVGVQPPVERTLAANAVFPIQIHP